MSDKRNLSKICIIMTLGLYMCACSASEDDYGIADGNNIDIFNEKESDSATNVFIDESSLEVTEELYILEVNEELLIMDMPTVWAEEIYTAKKGDVLLVTGKVVMTSYYTVKWIDEGQVKSGYMLKEATGKCIVHSRYDGSLDISTDVCIDDSIEGYAYPMEHNSNLKMTLPVDSQLKVTAKIGEWYEVQYDDQKLYVLNEQLKSIQKIEEPPMETEPSITQEEAYIKKRIEEYENEGYIVFEVNSIEEGEKIVDQLVQPNKYGKYIFWSTDTVNNPQKETVKKMHEVVTSNRHYYKKGYPYITSMYLDATGYFDWYEISPAEKYDESILELETMDFIVLYAQTVEELEQVKAYLKRPGRYAVISFVYDAYEYQTQLMDYLKQEGIGYQWSNRWGDYDTNEDWDVPTLSVWLCNVEG